MSEPVENEQPFSLHLVRRDPAQRMARFYAMHLAPTLFGGWDLVREWDRIGSPGTLRIDPSRRWRNPNAPCSASRSKSASADISRKDKGTGEVLAAHVRAR